MISKATSQQSLGSARSSAEWTALQEEIPRWYRGWMMPFVETVIGIGNPPNCQDIRTILVAHGLDLRDLGDLPLGRGDPDLGHAPGQGIGGLEVDLDPGDHVTEGDLEGGVDLGRGDLTRGETLVPVPVEVGDRETLGDIDLVLGRSGEEDPEVMAGIDLPHIIETEGT